MCGSRPSQIGRPTPGLLSGSEGGYGTPLDGTDISYRDTLSAQATTGKVPSGGPLCPAAIHTQGLCGGLLVLADDLLNYTLTLSLTIWLVLFRSPFGLTPLWRISAGETSKLSVLACHE